MKIEKNVINSLKKENAAVENQIENEKKSIIKEILQLRKECLSTIKKTKKIGLEQITIYFRDEPNLKPSFEPDAIFFRVNPYVSKILKEQAFFFFEYKSLYDLDFNKKEMRCISLHKLKNYRNWLFDIFKPVFDQKVNNFIDDYKTRIEDKKAECVCY